MMPYSPRIHILLARNSTRAVVIRRGPSKQVATILWDRRTDEFHAGQWMKGRIYERRCDLSDDGTYLIYFAMNGKWHSETRGSWTAISRAPFLKAIVLYPKGDCWFGGGLWTSRNTYWLNHGGGTTLADSNEVKQDARYVPQGPVGGECLSVYYPRLLRDGWRKDPGVHDAQRTSDRLDIFHKSINSKWSLCKIAHAGHSRPGKGCYWDEHALIDLTTGNQLTYPEWEWADWDGHRVLWAKMGKLFAGSIGEKGISAEQELMDFQAMHFQAIAAPYG